MKEGTETWTDLQGAKEAALEAQELVQQLLAYGRRGSATSTGEVSLANLVRGALRHIETSLPSNISIESELPEACFVPGDRAQLSQVVMNLCRNGCEAMEGDGGTLTVSLGRGETSSSGSVLRPKKDIARQIRLTISDTGRGIEPEVIDELFEPLFTTKGAEGGTGLGLAVVKRIVANHGGWITVESEVDRGTSFHVFLPLEREAEGSVPMAAAAESA